MGSQICTTEDPNAGPEPRLYMPESFVPRGGPEGLGDFLGRVADARAGGGWGDVGGGRGGAPGGGKFGLLRYSKGAPGPGPGGGHGQVSGPVSAGAVTGGTMIVGHLVQGKPWTGRAIAAIAVQVAVAAAGAVLLANPVTWAAVGAYTLAAGLLGVAGYVGGSMFDGSPTTLGGAAVSFAAGAIGFFGPAALGVVAKGTSLTAAQLAAFDATWNSAVGLAGTAAGMAVP